MFIQIDVLWDVIMYLNQYSLLKDRDNIYSNLIFQTHFKIKVAHYLGEENENYDQCDGDK